MDLKWQLSLLSMRAKRYFQRTGKKIFINGNDTDGYDKTKVECFNCHKLGHFARECRLPRNKDGQFKYQDNTRKQGNNEDTSSKAMLDIDGVGLETIEEQLVTYRKNEVLFSEEVAVLKREVTCKDYEIGVLKSDFEKVKQEKEGIDFKIEKFDNASKSLDKLLESQINDNSKKGLRYHAVPPPHPLIYNALTKLDLSYSGLDEFKEPKFTGYGPRNDKQESNINCDKKKSDNSEENTDDSLIKQVSEDERSFVESPLKVDKTCTVFDAPKKIEFVKPKINEIPVKKSVRYAEMYRPQRPRGNQRNWNGQKSNQLGSEFVMYKKACYNCGSFKHLQKNYPHHQRKRIVLGNNYNRVDCAYYAKTSHPSTHKSMPPRAVLLKSSLTPVNTARPIYTAYPKPAVNCARQMAHFSKQAQSTVQRPFYKKTTLTNKYFNQKVNTVRSRVVNTARPYRTPVNTVRAYWVNVVKPSACWGKPYLNDKGFVDSGCSRHMTGNIAYLLDFKEFDRDYVTFGGGAYGGRISGKGTLKTDNIDFKDVYFVNELKFNLFSVSQMCDKKNYVIFTDSGCLVLSPDFKLLDESQILLKIPRQGNMYSFDMKNIVLKEGLTYLVAKATLDESMLWHRRLGHINFKNINTLVKDNLVRGLPLKRFENDKTCVACLKGKQHRASLDKKVKIIRSDNGTEFKNKVMDDFCKEKGIRREYSVTRTPWQIRVAERRNGTLVEAARTMLANSKLPTIFWAEAVSTACYVHNRVLVVKPYNKTPYELFRGSKPALSFMRPFGCHVTILNTLDNLGKFDGKSDEVDASTTTNDFVGTQGDLNAGTSTRNDGTNQDCIVMLIWKDVSNFDSSSKNDGNNEPQSFRDHGKKIDEGPSNASGLDDEDRSKSSTSNVNTARPSVNTASANFRTGSLNINIVSLTVITTRSNLPSSVLDIFSLRDNATHEATNADLFGEETELDMSNLNISYQVPSTPTTRIYKDHSLDHVIGDIQSGVQTRGMTKTINEQGLLSAAYDRKPHEDLNTCMFFCFLSQEEPKRVSKALSDSAWVEAMQEELLQFKL
ncbi:putative ribonuclease H-like domain-containing protein [Tanacetum coccineum]